MAKNYIYIYIYRYAIALILLVLLVMLELNGSSIGLWNEMLNLKEKDSGAILGEPKMIRSDEWMVSTITTLSQYKNDFGWYSELARGTKTDMFISEQPVRDVSMIFRIFQIGYLFLSPSKAYSLFWWSRIIALFLATFEFTMLITNKNKKISLIITLLVVCAPTIQWWYATNFLIEMIVFAEVAIILLDKYMNTQNFKLRLLYSIIFFICARKFCNGIISSMAYCNGIHIYSKCYMGNL